MDVYTNQGIVFRKSTGLYTVKTEDSNIVTCTISTKLRKQLIYPTRDRSSLGFLNVQSVGDIKLVDPIAVGDKVNFMDSQDGTGHIIEVHPRTSKLTRRAPGNKPLEQIIIANADQVVVVTACAQPKPKWQFIDRYLASAEASGLQAVIIMTKTDLLKAKAKQKVMEAVDDYRKVGYEVLLTSSEHREGLDEVIALLKDKLSAFVGMSGVGKTTLLNAIQPELGLSIGRINERIDKGRHTTTHLEMFELDFGGQIIDTPGMKQFGLWNTEPHEVALLFREFMPYLGACKFGASCSHDHEPDCAVKKAIEAGEISPRRHQSYIYLRKYIYAED